MLPYLAGVDKSWTSPFVAQAQFALPVALDFMLLLLRISLFSR